MKKFLFSLVVLGGTVFSSFSQTTPADKGRFNVGLELGAPVGDASEGFSFVIGASLKYEHPVVENFFLTGSAGYSNFRIKSDYKVEGGKSGFGFIPVKVGGKYYFQKGFFGEAQFGAVFSTEEGMGTAFAYSPGIGYSFTDNVEAGIRYEAWSKDGTIGQFGLRLAYKF
ncbi:hypothetical protein [Mucilaginibacter gynuensis]